MPKITTCLWFDDKAEEAANFYTSLFENSRITVNCETQQQIDDYWEKLSRDGEKSQCGWLKDRYGLSWQVAPTVLKQMLQDKNPRKSEAAMKAMLQKTKLDIAALKQAYDKA